MPDWTQFGQLLDFCAVYYTTQLVRCAAFSFVLIGLVMLLRKKFFSKQVFLKGMLWALFLVIPFLGKLKLFYENQAVLRATWQITAGKKSWVWGGRFFFTGVFLLGIFLFV